MKSCTKVYFQKLGADCADRAATHWSHITRQTFDFDNKLIKLVASELTLEDVMEFYKEHLSEGNQRKLSVIVYSMENEEEAALDLKSEVGFGQFIASSNGIVFLTVLNFEANCRIRARIKRFRLHTY